MTANDVLMLVTLALFFASFVAHVVASYARERHWHAHIERLERLLAAKDAGEAMMLERAFTQREADNGSGEDREREPSSLDQMWRSPPAQRKE
jgi:hypothetical protein